MTEAEAFNAGIETAAHLLDLEQLRLHSEAARYAGETQRQLEADARYAGLMAMLIREKKRSC